MLQPIRDEYCFVSTNQVRPLPVEVGGVASVDEGQHLRHHIWMKILNVHFLALFLRHVCVEHCSEDWRSRITMIEHVNKSSFSPGRQHELVTVEGLVSTLDLHVAELLVDERVLQVLTQLLVSVRLLFETLGALLGILGTWDSSFIRSIDLFICLIM